MEEAKAGKESGEGGDKPSHLVLKGVAILPNLDMLNTYFSSIIGIQREIKFHKKHHKIPQLTSLYHREMTLHVY